MAMLPNIEGFSTTQSIENHLIGVSSSANCKRVEVLMLPYVNLLRSLFALPLESTLPICYEIPALTSEPSDRLVSMVS